MFFKQLDLTSGSRPILQQDETLLFVQNAVGVYEGKYKIGACQNGHAYLTSHRACYIDDAEPRTNSIAVDLRDVERHEHQAGFLRSSPKITLHPKPLKTNALGLRQHPPTLTSVHRLSGSYSSPISRTGSPFGPSSFPAASVPTYSGNWTCPICSFNNPVPSNFDPSNENFPLPPCLTCGVKPPFPVVLKAAIAATAGRDPTNATQDPPNSSTEASGSAASKKSKSNTVSCPRCTFDNHRSLAFCEVCNSPLPQSQPRTVLPAQVQSDRSQSPAPELASLGSEAQDGPPSIKFSFRAGGDKIFYERLKSAMIQRKWLTANAPPVPRPLDGLVPAELTTPSSPSTPDRSSTPRPAGVGIAGLEARGLQTRRNNEAVLGTAFEDLEALMASAREVVALAEKFALDTSGGGGAGSSSSPASSPGMNPLLSESVAAVGMVATKDMLSGGANKLYLTELARDLAEYVTDDRRAILKSQGGIMSLVDLWATFNRSRNGVELVSPTDFHKAAEMWATLSLPVRLREFKSGLLVVQHRDRSDEKTVAQLKRWLERLRQVAPHPESGEVAWDWRTYGYGVTAQDAAQEFGWSLGVATEELEMAEERAALCREEGVQGLKFWLNFLIDV